MNMNQKSCDVCGLKSPLTIRYRRRLHCPLCYERERSGKNRVSGPGAVPRYIAFEGLPGAGKRSLTKRLSFDLESKGWSVIGVERTVGVRTNYLPDQILLGRGSAYTKAVYESRDPEGFEKCFRKMAEHRPRPDLVFVLDLPVADALGRLVGLENRVLEEFSRDTLADIRRRFRALVLEQARRHKDLERSFVLIDARGAAEQVYNLVWSHIRRRFTCFQHKGSIPA